MAEVHATSGDSPRAADAAHLSALDIKLVVVSETTETLFFHADISTPYLTRVEEMLTQFDYFGGNERLDLAMADCVRALQLPSIANDMARRFQWNILEATALCLRFERDGHESDIHKAKGIFETLIASPGLDSGMLVQSLYGLGRVYAAFVGESSALDKAEKACECFREAKAAMNKGLGFPSRVSDELAVHLGRMLNVLSRAGPSESRLLEASALLSDVIQRNPKSRPITPYAVAQLSSVLKARFLQSVRDDNTDLIKSEELMREALCLGPHHRHRAYFLRGLADICIHWQTAERVRESIDLTKQALALLETTALRQIRPALLGSLSLAYERLYEEEGRLEDLDAAVGGYRLALQSKFLHPMIFANLCNDLCNRFEAMGQLVDIDEAIEAGRQALELRPSGYASDYAYGFLGNAYLLRFAAAGDQVDFDGARLNLELGLRNNSTLVLQPLFLLGLARLYEIQFDNSGDPADLDLAVNNGHNAIQITQTTQQREVPAIFSAHGAQLQRRFELSHNLQDLDDSISAQETALKLASPTNSDRHVFLWRYGRGLRLRFESLRSGEDLRRCSEILQEAIEEARSRQLPKQTLYMAETAALYSACYRFSSRLENLEESLGYYLKAAHFSGGLTADRFQAAVTGARLAQEHGHLPQAAELFSTAVSLLPRIAWLGLNASKRHAKLVRTAAQIACDAASIAITTGHLEHAVELLEEGRSILWRSILQLRTDLQSLTDCAPELAQELLTVGKALEHDDMGTSEVSETHAEERATRRRRMAERWEELVGSVRSLKGFESFLRPLDIDALRYAAVAGPIVLLNVSEYGSAALIVSSAEPLRTIPLPGLDIGTVRRLAHLLSRALRLVRDQLGRKILEKVLLDISRRLWNGGIDRIAAILLDQDCQTLDHPPHVWWIPTGFLSLLPIHCAGPYQAGQPGIPDLFISSYSTTLSALLAARKTRDIHMELSNPPVRMLAIGVPETPGLASLPSTGMEMELLENLPDCYDTLSILYRGDATVHAVINFLPEHNWIHASCHGHWDPQQPLDGAFKLVDGSLTLSKIVQMRLKDADFAFLSACHTARQTAQVPDESLHVAAGLQVAGFRGVIGTAWSMVDHDGPQVTKRFYRYLTLNGRSPDARNAAEALHLAVKDLRRIGMPLYRWAAFVHFGI